MKRILAIAVLLFMLVPVIYTMATLHDSDPMEAVSRNWDQGDVSVILEEGVPLAQSAADANYCLQTLDLINKYRVGNGRQALLWSVDLEDAAEIRAAESQVLWSHTRPSGQPYYTVNPKVVYGENLGKGYATPQDLFNAWVASPTHNDNLLFARFKYCAIAKVGTNVALEFCY